jgi:soluble cytochrome b562
LGVKEIALRHGIDILIKSLDEIRRADRQRNLCAVLASGSGLAEEFDTGRPSLIFGHETYL